MTKPKGTPEEILTKKLLALTNKAVGKCFKLPLPGKAKLSKVPDEPVSDITKKTVAYLKSRSQAFGCNRPDVIGVLSAIVGEDINKFLVSTPVTQDFEEHPDFDDQWNETRIAGVVITTLHENGTPNETLIHYDVENNYYLDQDGCSSEYFFSDRSEFRLATTEELLAFITHITLDNLAKYIIIL